MTDFLDRLEADLRVAAERRGRRRRPRFTPALKLVAAAAVLALLAIAAAGVVDGDISEQAAPPPRTPKIAVTTTGDVSELERVARHLLGTGFVAAGKADRSLGSVVLYRPGADKLAERVAERTGIDAIGPLTGAEEEQLHGDVSRASVVAVLGPDVMGLYPPCKRAGTVTGGTLEVCASEGLLVDGRALAVEQPSPVGHWAWAAASPDGATILAEWTAECEVPQAFSVPAAGGKPRPLIPGDVESNALGWTTDGDALVFIPKQPACGIGREPGTYLVPPGGEPRRISRTRLPRSIEPRPVP
jgi:hypothetical protein